MRARSLYRLGLVAVFVACATPPKGAKPAASRNVITQEEIAKAGSGNIYQVIQRLRPEFFSYRGETSINQASKRQPDVILDGGEMGSADQLQQIPASQVASVRLYRSWEASTKFGARFVGGVIEVKTKHGGK